MAIRVQSTGLQLSFDPPPPFSLQTRVAVSEQGTDGEENLGNCERRAPLVLSMDIWKSASTYKMTPRACTIPSCVNWAANAP